MYICVCLQGVHEQFSIDWALCEYFYYHPLPAYIWWIPARCCFDTYIHKTLLVAWPTHLSCTVNVVSEREERVGTKGDTLQLCQPTRPLTL